jgi:1,4-alpha-glucan branching enzyme
MPASQQHIDGNTPMGARLTHGGATFRTWAPAALAVYLVRGRPGGLPTAYSKDTADLLLKDDRGYWSGFVPGFGQGDMYRFYVVGAGSEGFKRDPYARELERRGSDPWYPCNCIVCDPAEYVWHDQAFRPPAFSDLIVYQFHIGVFFAQDENGRDIRRDRVSKILDVADRIEYWADLGITAVMPLPFQEYQGENSLGYNGTDLFSPEMDYSVSDAELDATYLARVNRLFAAKGAAALPRRQLSGQINQFKAFIDLCHLHGIAVITDVVYNHAGGGFDDESIKFFDREPYTTDNNSLFFTDQDHAGGRVFAFWKREVRQFLIDNARLLLEEYHVDGIRYDQVTVIAESGGWSFAQDLTNTVRFIKPEAVQIAEYWGGERWRGVATPPSGMGFDVGYSDVFRQAMRDVLRQTAGGRDAHVSLDGLRDALYATLKMPGRWTVFQCLENHDLLDDRHGDRQPRIPVLAGGGESRTWYARSRTRAATGVLLAAPGVPMIFMGEEFLEDKYWTDDPHQSQLFIWWAGLQGGDKAMADQHRFTGDMLWLRRRHPALRADGLNVFHVHNDNRVIAFHRWIPGAGRDVVVVASFNEMTFGNRRYRLGFPGAGHWHEVFNSDIYDEFFNPNAQGNPGGLVADGPAWDGLPASAGVTIPANAVLVFARDHGDG